MMNSLTELILVFCAAIICNIISALKVVRRKGESYFYFPMVCLLTLGCIEIVMLPVRVFLEICPWLVIGTIVLCAVIIFRNGLKAFYPGMIGVLLFCIGDILVCRLEGILTPLGIGGYGNLLYVGIIAMLLGFSITTFASEIKNTLPELINVIRNIVKTGSD